MLTAFDPGEKRGDWSFFGDRMTFVHKSFKWPGKLTLGRFCIIEEGCRIGEDCELMDYVKLMPGTIIGNNCKLDDYVNTSGYCRIGNNVRIKRCSMIGQAVEIEDEVKIMSHITTVRVRRPDKSKDEEWSFIRKGAVMGSHSCLLPGVTVGEGAVVGAGAVVTKDCRPGWIYVGNPARPARKV